jgi:cytoskeletal protein RodZ
MMLTRNTRRLALGVLVLGLLAFVSLWPDTPSPDDSTSQVSSTDVAQQASASATSPADTDVPASTDADPVGSAGVSQIATTAAEVGGAPVRLQVYAPSDVQVGEVFQAGIDFEGNGGVRELSFAVSYEKSRLALVGWSEGTLAQQVGLPVEFEAEEPSDGNIQVTYKVSNGLSVAGAGSMTVFQFEAIKAGTSGITLQNLTVIDRTGAANPNVAVVREASVTVH